jgi:hypothetical protein
MQIKLLELRDEGTFIPLLCVNMNPSIDNCGNKAMDRFKAQMYLLRRCGYPCDGKANIAITHLGADGKPFWNDPYGWGGPARTYHIAHTYIITHWDELKDGDVVDVQFILGETKEPKQSERLTMPI